ncbi:hypothetical protein [Algoriphagus sp. NG3]|uniref:hypothetical protein n=1 Tax=Algoriphagus sp. NG3 TaxID=3097546 RepID=UPI002A8224C4|nr:hypothetical protein [Algoriphagus sp. NG3]WPR77379.1 hypothetical protein SLW71_08470 [Algoriphagus sp. NG3]
MIQNQLRTMTHQLQDVRSSIYVFATTIDSQDKAEHVCLELHKMKIVNNSNVDLDDYENILRVECETEISPQIVSEAVHRLGFDCLELT